MRKPIKVAQKLSDGDGIIVRLNVPTEVYFNDKGELEGFCVDISNHKSTRYQRNLVRQAVRVILGFEDEAFLPDKKVARRIKVPKVFRDAFKA
jgi:hypothetical protein